VQVFIPGLVTKLPNRTRGEHWATRKKRSDMEKLVVTARLRGASPMPPDWLRTGFVLVSFTRFSSRKPDYDNLVASFKAVQDATCAWLGRDDGDPELMFRYQHSTGEKGVTIRLWRDPT